MDPGRNETMARLLELRTQRTLSSGTEGHRISSCKGKIQAYFICWATTLELAPLIILVSLSTFQTMTKPHKARGFIYYLVL